MNTVLEGAVRPGEDYTQLYASVLPPLIIVAMAAGAAMYAWRWRVIWKRSSALDCPD